jgi:hypothetical protein
MKTKTALDALTDQAIAHLADQRRTADTFLRAQLPTAGDLAAMLRTQFADDLVLAGRVAVSCAQALSQIIRALPQIGLHECQVAPVAANMLAFAGEELAREDVSAA